MMPSPESRFGREELLIGSAGLKRLASSHVAVFGIGGVGSFCAEALARAGVGELTLVDSDAVRLSNANRQLVALESTMGAPKVEVMARRALDINPSLKVHAVQEWFDEANSERMLSTDYDYVADAIDSVSSKLLLIASCIGKGIPVVSSMGAGNKLDATGFRIADISDTHTCPLAKVVRTGLRKRGIEKGLKVVFSVSKPVDRPAGPPGSISYVPPVAGLLLAQAVIEGLLG
ncbi:MAG TPA: tRNA threonylcarbamoyladenosine dehydratase [Bacillota bacterium]|nr:tRNA threonylcarbamoyladenosine dehydratase [Bacillota bacterium]HOG52321.1 tRNA threonylcarbamoyladenosine dehydratase [Bacillota bacterium]